MKNISLSEDVVPVGRFKAEMAAWLKRVSREHRHTVITQNGVPAAVLISPEEYDDMRRRLLENVSDTAGKKRSNYP